MNWKVLPRSFYQPSAKRVAPRLLGHWLIRRTPDGECGGTIVEVEAYLRNDPACHGAVGLTARNRSMWGAPGRGYVYLIYGYHYCVNAVCQPEGVAEAVLIRAIEPTFGQPLLLVRRPVRDARQLTNGPAKLCAAMDIDRQIDACDLCDRRSPLFIAENPDIRSYRRQAGPIRIAPRIGISKAANLELRFYLENSLFVSRRHDSKPSRETAERLPASFRVSV